MVDLTAVRIAMRQQLITAVDVSGKLPMPITQIPTQWENKQFSPPDPTATPALWIRETWMPASEKKVATGLQRLSGIWQYDCFDAIGNGTTLVEALSKMIGDAFKPSTAINRNGIQIPISRSERKAGGEGHVYRGKGNAQVWYQVPVLVTISAYEFITD